MALRHALALAAGETSNLIDLADILKQAVEDCIAAGEKPFKDAACRVICYQIAFAGNGDITFHPYWSAAFVYCTQMAIQDQQGFPLKETPVAPPEPLLQ
jgi:hypothetical protein